MCNECSCRASRCMVEGSVAGEAGVWRPLLQVKHACSTCGRLAADATGVLQMRQACVGLSSCVARLGSRLGSRLVSLALSLSSFVSLV